MVPVPGWTAGLPTYRSTALSKLLTERMVTIIINWAMFFIENAILLLLKWGGVELKIFSFFLLLILG